MEFDTIKKMFYMTALAIFGSGALVSPYFIKSLINNNIDFFLHKEYLSSVLSNSIKYEEDIKEYNDVMKFYCDEFKKENMTDLECFIKLMMDTCNQVEGYASDVDKINGYQRLVLYKQKKGCCRNFADDMVAKLNYINPKYNARLVYVWADENFYNDAYTLPIKIEILHVDKKENNENNENNEKKEMPKQILDANHVVCAVDIPGKNITLMLDPTNTVIGYFKGHKIITFGSDDSKVKYSLKSNYIFSESLKDYLKNELKLCICRLYPKEKILKLYDKSKQIEVSNTIMYKDSQEKDDFKQDNNKKVKLA